MLESLFCAEDIFDDNLIISYADIVYEPKVLTAILAAVTWNGILYPSARTQYARACSPLKQGRLQGSPVLPRLAERYDVKPLQVALAWVLAQKTVIAIPKAVNHQHID